MNNQLKNDENEGNDPDVAYSILQTFYKNDSRDWRVCIAEFVELQQKEVVYRIDLDLDFESKEARYFIKADTLLANADLVGLYNHLSGKNVKSIDIHFARQVKNEFLQSVAHFKDLYEWIYNPPAMPGLKKWSAGRDMRNEFQQYYGSYAELTYLIAHGEALKFNEVNSMILVEYLALGEYLLRKRAVEGVE